MICLSADERSSSAASLDSHGGSIDLTKQTTTTMSNRFFGQDEIAC
jgi:hypothetical protein